MSQEVFFFLFLQNESLNKMDKTSWIHSNTENGGTSYKKSLKLSMKKINVSVYVLPKLMFQYNHNLIIFET